MTAHAGSALFRIVDSLDDGDYFHVFTTLDLETTGPYTDSTIAAVRARLQKRGLTLRNNGHGLLVDVDPSIPDPGDEIEIGI